jgi:sec-independent protein translocase protein TatB
MFPEGRVFEFLLAAVIALVVVGPKDLPVLMRKLGQAVGKMRALAAEFRASFDEMARQSELDELRKEVEAMRRAQIADIAGHAAPEAGQAFADIHQDLRGMGAEMAGGDPPPYYAAPSTPPPAPEPAVEAAPEAKAPPTSKPRAKRAPRPAATAAAPAKPRARKKAEPKA